MGEDAGESFKKRMKGEDAAPTVANLFPED